MHKPLAVLRTDQVEGSVEGFNFGESEAGGLETAPPLRKRDIPTPIIATVAGYEAQQAGSFKIPAGYIRFPRRTAGEDDASTCEYCLEIEDEEWLDKHRRYGVSAPASEREKLGADRLERMVGILEMATGQADPIPLPQAETLFVSKLSMSKAVHQEVWAEVYRFWKEKRARLGKPLLRRFWPVTPSNDTDPHKVFRPREKERYKLRKHRKNDLDSFRKLQQVKKDFEKLLNITRMIQKREAMKREQLMVQQEIFLQQHWDLTDTTGEARPLMITPGRYKTSRSLTEVLMIDQDYEELLGRAPPHGDVLEWTFPTSYLANAFASLLVGTPVLCLVLYGSGESSGDWDPRGGAELRIPTLTRLGLQGPAGEVLTAGLHLAAVVALPLFWCVRLAHHQRLQARTGVARYDQEADGAMRWITAAWIMGALGAIFLFVGASVPGDDRASFSAQGVAHLTLFVSAAAGFVGQATCTAWALRKARRVFVVSDADRVSYRRKMWLASLTAVAALATVASVLLIERFVDDAWADSSSDTGIVSTGAFEAPAVPAVPAGASLAASFETVAIEVRGGGGGGGRDCDAEWCYSRSALGLWEWVLLVLEAAFCVSLRHDLIPATGGVGVESFVL